MVSLDGAGDDEFVVRREKDFKLSFEGENIYSGTSMMVDMDDIENFNKLYVDMAL